MADIDYGKILSRSFEITKKNKWLWIYGLVLAIFASAGGGGSGGGSGGVSNTLKKIPKDIPQDLPEKTSQVLGQTTTVFREWIASIPTTTWIMFILGILAVILLWALAAWIIRSWAKAGLIRALDDVSQNKVVTLPDTSLYGLTKIKFLVLYGLISAAITIVTILVAVIIVVVGLALLSFASARGFYGFWLIASGVVVGGSLVILLVLYSMIAIYAERLIVLYNYTPWQAWKKGFSLSRNNLLSTVVMGIINMVAGCTLGCLANLVVLLIFAVPGILFILPIFKNGFRFPGITTIFALILLFILFIWVNYVIRAILTVFNFSNWNLFFTEVIREEKHNV